MTFYLLKGGDITLGIPPGALAQRALTSDDARLLRVRFVQLRARRLYEEADWILHVMQGLSISPPARHP